MKYLLIISLIAIRILAAASATVAGCESPLFSKLTSPIIFEGNETIAYRDPTAFYHDGVFHLYFSYSRLDTDGGLISVTGHSKSTDLKNWSTPVPITVYDRNLNFCSPGNVIEYGDGLDKEWIICVSSYPTPKANQVVGSEDARLWIMRSKDLSNWSKPELLRVKGPKVAKTDMGRMIDPYLVEDKDEPGKWWCFYKQNGVSRSYSYDLKNWTYVGNTPAGENVCVFIDHKGDSDKKNDEYVMFASPSNGVAVSRSTDLAKWTSQGVVFLGQKDWHWASGRLTAGFVLNLREEPSVGKYVMFFHGSQPRSAANPETFGMASLGIAWSDDLIKWNWPDSDNAHPCNPVRVSCENNNNFANMTDMK